MALSMSFETSSIYAYKAAFFSSGEAELSSAAGVSVADACFCSSFLAAAGGLVSPPRLMDD